MPEPVLFLVLSAVLLIVPIVLVSKGSVWVLRAVDKLDQARLSKRRTRRDALAREGHLKPERTILKTCSNCDALAITLRYRDPEGRTFCSALCREYTASGRPTLCAACKASTKEEQVDAHMTEIGIGWDYGKGTAPCSDCGSELRTLWLKVFFLPLLRLATCRTIPVSPYRYIARPMRSDLEAESASGSEGPPNEEMQQTRSALTSNAAALAADLWCSTDYLRRGTA